MFHWSFLPLLSNRVVLVCVRWHQLAQYNTLEQRRKKFVEEKREEYQKTKVGKIPDLFLPCISSFSSIRRIMLRATSKRGASLLLQWQCLQEVHWMPSSPSTFLPPSCLPRLDSHGPTAETIIIIIIITFSSTSLQVPPTSWWRTWTVCRWTTSNLNSTGRYLVLSVLSLHQLEEGKGSPPTSPLSDTPSRKSWERKSIRVDCVGYDFCILGQHSYSHRYFLPWHLTRIIMYHKTTLSSTEW